MITLIDWGIWLVYATLIFTVLWVYRTTRTEEYYKYFLSGFLIKIFGGVAFALIYVYYYGFGDTFLYHQGATVMADTLTQEPGVYFRLLASGEGSSIAPELTRISSQIAYSRTYEEWFMVKLLSPINLISFNSYLVSTLFLSTLSFVGAWKLFRVFADILPQKEWYGFVAAFLVPSVVFWGSGIMKDTVTLFAINYMIYTLYFSLFKKRFSLSAFAIIAFCGYVIISLKAYILLAFLPGLSIGLYYLFANSLHSTVLKWVMGPAIFGGLIAVSFFGLSAVGDSSEKYQSSNLEYQVKGFHSWHTDVGGSSYDLGEIEYTATGVTRKIPAAWNVTFFRPYIWEARSPVVLIGALESLTFLAMFISILWYYRLRFISVLRKYPVLLGALVFTLIFGFAVGFTSYNFGALARYKIPIMSLYVFILIFLYHFRKRQQSDKTLPSDQPFA